MQNFAILVKSFSGDIERVKSLLNSCNKFNKERIPVYISIPKEDYKLFKDEIVSKEFKVIIDEEVSVELIRGNVNGVPMGYLNQQIVKLNFWKYGVCSNYFCADSDSYFIKDFYYTDFMYDEITPYTVLIQDKDLAIEPEYQRFWQPRLKSLKYIKEQLGCVGKLYKTSHGFGILSAKVLESFEHDFLKNQNLSYKNILTSAFFEMSWYNFWLQKTKIIQIIPIEPLFKTFHFKQQYMDCRARMIAENDIARAYLGICLNSSWLKNPKTVKYEDPTYLERLFCRLRKNVRRITRKVASSGVTKVEREKSQNKKRSLNADK